MCPDFAPSVSNIVGGKWNVQDFRAANGVLFFTAASTGAWQGYRLFSGAVGGAWVQQSTSEISRYAVTAAGDMFYFTVGTKLYSKAYTLMGGAAETEIIDFAGVLTDPEVGAIDITRPNTILILDADSVYRYTNSVQIP